MSKKKNSIVKNKEQLINSLEFRSGYCKVTIYLLPQHTYIGYNMSSLREKGYVLST